jgi:hypothetical protein
VVDDDWQCGQFMVALLISQNGPDVVNLDITARRARLRAEIKRYETELTALKAELEEIGDDEEEGQAAEMDHGEQS